MDVALGMLLVALVALRRFAEAPPARRSTPVGRSRTAGMVLNWFQLTGEPDRALFPPPRANTTVFNFWLYASLYAAAGLAVYLAILGIEPIRAQIASIVSLIGNFIPAKAGDITDAIKVGLDNASPLVLAFVVSLLLPLIPPARGIDADFRRFLYTRASIPGQQLRERNRLKEAEFKVTDRIDAVVGKLVGEGFDPVDLAYDEAAATAQSLWIKASLLIDQIRQWSTRQKYKTAFAVLKDRETATLSADSVEQAYGSLRGDAKLCFDAMRANLEAPETKAREDTFRQNCKNLLIQIYDFLSRVSLHSHYTDRERVASMRRMGFQLSLHKKSPIPDLNELVCLGIILAAVVVFPLGIVLGFGRAVAIAAIVFSAVLTPILIAHKIPRVTRTWRGPAPAVAFPALSGLVAVIVGLAISFGILLQGEDIATRWQSYMDRRVYQWSAQIALVAILVAVRMRAGSYPSVTEGDGIARYRQWGSLQDAAIFGICAAALRVAFMWPEVMAIDGSLEWSSTLRRFAVPTVMVTVIGFFVPTWYRASVLRIKEREGTAQVPPA